MGTLRPFQTCVVRRAELQQGPEGKAPERRDIGAGVFEGLDTPPPGREGPTRYVKLG